MSYRQKQYLRRLRLESVLERARWAYLMGWNKDAYTDLLYVINEVVREDDEQGKLEEEEQEAEEEEFPICAGEERDEDGYLIR